METLAAAAAGGPIAFPEEDSDRGSWPAIPSTLA